jgi:hypothetical protein
MNHRDTAPLPAYSTYLPPLYLKEPDGFVTRFLGLFEALLAGLEEPSLRKLDPEGKKTEFLQGIEQLLDRIHLYSDPMKAPGPDTAAGAENGPWRGYFDENFLPYLAGWLALTLKKRWPAVKQRRLIHSIVPLYKKRGTLQGISEFLKIFVESPVRVHEELGLQVGIRATVGTNTIVGGWPHLFKVEIIYGYRESQEVTPKRFDVEFLRFISDNTIEILNLEKPAHTDYRVLYNFPGFVVGEYSTVGWDTLLWSRTPIELAGGD